MPTLSVVNFNIVCATLGGFITLFGLVSYLFKEKFYLSEALISTIAGIIVSPHGANFIDPLAYAHGDEVDLETITLYFTRLVLGVQLVLAGVQLPSKYLRTEWKSLSILLGPGMCCMWIVTSLLVWALVPDIPFLWALAVGSCVTPTDPVLSNSIVKGKFADKNIPPKLQKIIIAESGANDGLGYPFLFLALYLIKYAGQPDRGSHSMALWFGDTWGYTILLSVVYGAVVGWIAKELLHWAEERRYVDRESFLVFAITLALFIVGTVGMIGSDDVLACFIAGNAFTWDDWFRLETMDDSLQPTIDMLLNVSIFMWFGAVCPWHSFVANSVIPIYRLIPLGILVLLLRRLPMVLGFHKKIHQIDEIKHALFVGFFGPIGVSAIFYLYISREFLRQAEEDGYTSIDAEKLMELLNVVIWFLTVCSIFVHGLSIPLGKLGFHLPRTISTAISSERVSINRSTSRSREASPQSLRQRVNRSLPREFHRRPTTSELGPNEEPVGSWSILDSVKRIGSHLMSDLRRASIIGHDASKGDAASDSDQARPRLEVSAPTNPRPIGRAVGPSPLPSALEVDGPRIYSQSPMESRAQSPAQTPVNRSTNALHRSIRFGDEPARPPAAEAPTAPSDHASK